MRVVQNQQMTIGEIDISKIEFDPKSRDEIPKILKGLQYLYMNQPLRLQVFQLLEAEILPKANKFNGRPGMELWKILVCGVLRLEMNADYDRLHEMVNHHDTIRQMLGHGVLDDKLYQLQTLKDNVGLLTPELLNKINLVVVNAGHILVKKKEEEALRGRCDSFVVETDVHFPTDISLLFDATRKFVELTAHLCEDHGVSVWRQYAFNIQKLKRLMRAAQNKKRSKANSEARKEKKEELIIAAHQKYLDVAQQYLDKAQETIAMLEKRGFINNLAIVAKTEIEGYMKHAERQIDQTRRRVILGEVIPHEEKVFSIFEPHTEWISKGKAGVPVELGVRVCVLEDQHQFILHHHVMEKTTDDKVAVSMIIETKKHFPSLNVCSFDKGFHSPSNQSELKKHLDLAVLPRKGRLSQQARAEEQAEAFVKARRQHSAVESAINGLEVNGLDMCPDHGINGFKRYVALAVVARNIHRIGVILWQQEQAREKRKRKYSDRDTTYKLAA